MSRFQIGPAAPTIPVDLLLAAERSEQEVRCGAWSLRLTDGRLDDIRFGSARILRGVRVVVRDQDWATFETTGVEAAVEGDVLRIEAASVLSGGRVEWTLRVDFTEAALSVDLEARVTTPFLRNRLGLIVLHAPECAGTPLEVRHASGDPERIVFPERIAPHQPARDIAGLAWTADGVPVELDLTGDVFEMEDQRNWTDASFKTYSTPLALPFPVEVGTGDTIRQGLRLRCSGAPSPEAAEASESVVTVQTGPEGHPLPEIRTAASSAPESDRSTGGATLGLLVECDLRWAGWRRALHRALEDSGGRPVDLRIVATAPGDVRAVLDELGDAPLARLGAFAAGGHLSGSDLLDVARRAAHERGAQVVGGVRSHFTELTRNVEALAPLDVPLAFSITPFMHDRSGHQLVESLAMQRAVVRDAAEIAAGRRLHVGPVTLGARMNAVSTSPFDPGETDIDRTGYGPATTPGATDERQTSPALAAWVVGSIEALAAPTVDSLSYFEEWGPRGISVGDRPTPAGRVLEWAAELSGWSRVGVSAAVDVSDAPVSAQLAELGLAAVGAARGGERVVLLGNIGGRSVTLSPAQVVDWHRSSDGALGEGSVVLAPGDAVRLRLAPQPSSV